jgi:hypothetical protein
MSDDLDATLRVHFDSREQPRDLVSSLQPLAVFFKPLDQNKLYMMTNHSKDGYRMVVNLQTGAVDYLLPGDQVVLAARAVVHVLRQP